MGSGLTFLVPTLPFANHKRVVLEHMGRWASLMSAGLRSFGTINVILGCRIFHFPDRYEKIK